MKNNAGRKLKLQSPVDAGMSLVEVLILTGIMSVVALAVASMVASNNKIQKQAALVYNVDQVRRNMNSLLSNSKNWQSTLLQNSQTTSTGVPGSTLSCLQTSYGALKPNCNNKADYRFKVYTAGDDLYFDQDTQGFTADGEVCLKADFNCIIDLDIKVRTVCAKVGGVDPPDCVTPSTVTVMGTLTFSANAQWTGPYNPNNYAISVRKDGEGASDAATGDIQPFIGTAAREGWVLANGGTIGNGGSAATLRANDDTQQLFEQIWNSIGPAYAVVSGGRGATAAGDFAAGKTIAVPDLRGRTVFGKDDMGGGPTNRLVTSINGTLLGNYGGSELMQSHAHTINGGGGFTTGNNAGCGCGGGGGVLWASGWLGGTDWAGGGGSQNLPPAYIVMYQIKL